MNVKQLIKRIEKLDPDMLVVMSTDSEGNGFDTLSSIETHSYKDGEIGLLELTPELKERGYTDEDLLVGGKPAVVLWP
jgi:hypothetical protein